MRNAYLDAIYELTQNDPKRIYSCVADIGAIIFDKYRRDFPQNFLNFGIAESTMISTAAGMASNRLLPYTYTIVPFLVMRAFEQIRNSVCLQEMNVKMVGVGGGFRYSTLGPTHHSLCDIAIMRSLPNMRVIAPADPFETRQIVLNSLTYPGPLYIRLGITKEPSVYTEEQKQNYSFELGKGIVLKDGEDLTIMATGNSVHDALLAADNLEKQGIKSRVVNLHTVKPIDKELVLESARKTKVVITVETHNIIGGLGEAISGVLAENLNEKILFKRLGVNDQYCNHYGDYEDLQKLFKIDFEAITQAAIDLLDRKI